MDVTPQKCFTMHSLFVDTVACCLHVSLALSRPCLQLLHPLPLLPLLPLPPPCASVLPSSSSHSACNMQATVAEHRRMLRESDKTGHWPRIKGRFGTHAEQLRNWLGEYLLAKYDQTCQLSTQRDIAGYVALARCSAIMMVCLFSAKSKPGAPTTDLTA